MPKPEYITVLQLSRREDVSPSYIYRLINEGKIAVHTCECGKKFIHKDTVVKKEVKP